MAEDNIINNLYKFRIVSLNVRGLRDYKKRRKVYNWASKQDGQNGIKLIVIRFQNLNGVINGKVFLISPMVSPTVAV